jgi:hypothetical protein
MKRMPFIMLVCMSILATTPCWAKRPKKEKKPKHQKVTIPKEEKEPKEPRIYQPNPVVLAGVGQIVNGALSIAQDPHSRPNIGHSIAHMIHGIMSIIVEKIANKKIEICDKEVIEECLNQLCTDIRNEITEIIATKKFLIQNYSNTN